MIKWGLLLLFLMCSQTMAGEVRVAVAANFLSTLNVLIPDFEKLSGHSVVVSGASSGKLYAQIIHGAPYDVLLSADREYPTKLETAGQVVVGSRFVYATGQLVLWSRDAQQSINQDSLVGHIGRIAIANPRTAPYGKAAQQVLSSLDNVTQIKLIQGESVAQAFQFSATGNVDYGFVALSQVLSPFNKFNRNYYWLIPAALHSPLDQEVALLVRGKDNPAATEFLEFIKSPEAQAVIAANGYR